MAKRFFWDSCVFIAALNNESDYYDIASIKKYLKEAESDSPDKVVIYTSAIIFSEVTPRKLFKSEFGTFEEFIKDFRGVIEVVEASPSVCSVAGRLKDLHYSKNGYDGRVLTTGDAIMLASILELEDVFGVTVDAMHTYDNGKRQAGPEGKAIPMLEFHTWCEGIEDDPLAKRIIGRKREKPIHPQPEFGF